MNDVQRGVFTNRCEESYCKTCENNGTFCTGNKKGEMRKKNNELELDKEEIEKIFSVCSGKQIIGLCLR